MAFDREGAASIVNKLIKMMPYLIIIIAAFYLLPLLIQDTGAGMLILLVAIPFVCLVTSILYGAKQSFNVMFSIFVAILFIPSLFIFYNSSAWVYIIGYGVVSMIGNLIGMAISKSEHKSENT